MDCPEGFRVFVDANLTGLGKWLTARDPGYIHVGHPRWPFSQFAEDEDWLDFVGGCGWAVLMRDKRVRFRPREVEMLRRHRTVALVIAVREPLDITGQQALIEEFGDEINAVLEGGRPGVHHLTRSGIRLMEGF